MVRDRLWIWTHPVGSHDYIDPGDGRAVHSQMTPAGGAEYLGLSNVYFIQYGDNPPVHELESYAVDLRAARRVIWSLTAGGGGTSAEMRDEVLRLAHEFPNFGGFVLDDFLHFDTRTAANVLDGPAASDGPVPASMTPAELSTLRRRTVINGRRLPTVCVVYTYQLSPRIRPHVDQIDKIALWTWQQEDLASLEDNLARMEQIAPGKPIILGCYMFDYGNNKPMTVENMERQCTLGLRWLREGRIDGMIFLASNVCDVGLEAVEWTRGWIASVGDEPLGRD